MFFIIYIFPKQYINMMAVLLKLACLQSIRMLIKPYDIKTKM